MGILFQAETEADVPWNALIDLIVPYCPKTASKGGYPPYPLSWFFLLPRTHLRFTEVRLNVPRNRRRLKVCLYSWVLPPIGSASTTNSISVADQNLLSSLRGATFTLSSR